VAKLVLIYGEEEFLMERAARDEARLCVPDEILEFRLPDELDDYLAESQSPLIVGGRRAFILWEADSIPALPESKDDVLIVVGGKKPLSHPQGRSIQFNKLKTYDNNNEVVNWILKEGERRGIELNRVANALFVNCGNVLRKLASEIEKLAVLTPPGTQVTPDVARSVLCFSTELSPKQIIESICEGNTVKALAYYEKLQERNDETGWIIAYMQRHVSQQLRSDALLESEVSTDRAAGILSVHPYVFSKTFGARRDLWSRQSLIRSFCTLCDLDVLHKKGVDVRCRLESEIVILSEEAQGGRN
jgi:DNA polymerase III delta subunit